MKVGIIGYSEGNGHPFSFSSIVNGYDPDAYVAAGWQPILNYLQAQPESAFGFDDVQITHAWTQHPELTQQICAASKISQAVDEFQSMVDVVDAVIIARDDYETHATMAKPFLEKGIPVFVDKPLTLDMAELSYFEPYLHQGLLMSTSGMRYARELDAIRETRADLGELVLIEAVVLNQLAKYGIHMLDALNSFNLGKVKHITRMPTDYEAYTFEYANGLIFNLSCLGAVGKTFHLSFYGSKQHRHFDLHDNFSAFQRTLKNFFQMVQNREPVIDPSDTVDTMRLLYQASALQANESVQLSK